MKRSRERKPNRLPCYDYSTPGWYFVTICVKDMNCVFGEVVDGRMVLNKMGKVAREQWLWIESHFEYVGLDKCIIMPNHLHGIVVIKGNNNSEFNLLVGTGRDLSLRKRKSLSELIGAFKTTSSKKINESGMHFRWQRSFYDHIIDFEKNELENIRDYIKNNPTK